MFSFLINRAERELSNRLRREQDEAFAESLAVDRAKAAERAANEEAAAQLAAQAADAERRAARLARARLRRQRYWTRALPPAPTPRNATTPTVRLSTKLPNGQRAQRVFSVKDSVKVTALASCIRFIGLGLLMACSMRASNCSFAEI